MQIQPYLFFEGRTEEAIEFYKKALGAQVEMLMRFKDAPPDPEGANSDAGGCAPAPADMDKVMHASFLVGGQRIMASDGMNSGKAEFKGMALSLSYPTDAETKRAFDALADGGQVQQPLVKTFFSSAFGMVADRFGMNWMVITDTGNPPA
ncbi:VOC family protein [Xenophilus azovorans]|uniref:VOC family protein n=1 Tax=Xenophilus azovorans TaxID=151755 RepID=UPI000571BC8B|nr:VOC family protein [Xenophilus azovorans]